MTTAIYFGTKDRPLFGWLAIPADGAVSGGVILSGTIGMEEYGVRPALECLETALVDAGFASLRVDYDGTGDSAGAWEDPNRLSAWTTSIAVAASHLRAVGAQQIVLVGAHFGALLTAKVARQSGASGVVLWEPTMSGRAFLRQQALLLSTLHHGRLSSTVGMIETPLFAYPEEVAGALTEDAVVTSHDLTLAPTLVVSRSGRLPRELARVGWSADCVCAESPVSATGEYPSPDAPPLADARRIARWIRDHVATTAFEAKPEGRTSATLAIGDRREAIFERPVSIGRPPLFGIMAEPSRPLVTDKIVIFLTSGLWSHVGPSYLWTKMSRAWAAVGVPSLRVDISGIGGSGTRDNQSRQLALSPHLVEDSRAIASYFGDESGRNLILVGFSSGGYNAIEVALNLRPSAILIANPLYAARLDIEEILSSKLELHRSYKPLPRTVARLARRQPRAGIIVWRLLSQVLINWATEESLSRVVRRRTNVYLFAGEEDFSKVQGHLIWSVVWRWYRYRRRLTIKVVPDVDHGFYTYWQRVTVERTLTDWVMDAVGMGEFQGGRIR